jgi:hypothetical protein
MSEIKQLLMNGFFKKILLFIFLGISTFLLVFLNHDKWLEYKSWIHLFLWVALFQIIFFGLIKLSSWIPWKKLYKHIHTIFFEKTVDPDLNKDMECMENDFMQVAYYLDGRCKYYFFSIFSKNKIKLPFYVCFESTRGIAEQGIKEGAYEEVFIKNSSNKIKIILSEKAVFCILSYEILKEQGSRWLGFLRFVKKNSRNFSSISALIFVKNRDDIFDDLGKWLQMCRYKIEEMTRFWNRFVPSHGISYEAMGLQGFEQFVKNEKVSDHEVTKLNFGVLSSDDKKECLSHLFKAIHKKWNLYRFFSIEKLHCASDKWENFMFPGRQEGFFERLSTDWGKIIQDTPFNKPNSMHSFYFVESCHSEKMVWKDLMKNTIDLEKKKITKGTVYYSTMMKFNMGLLIIGFLIFSIWNVSHVCAVSYLTSFYKTLGKDIRLGLLAQAYIRHTELESRSFMHGGIFSLSRHDGWSRSRQSLLKNIQDRLNHVAEIIENRLIDEEKKFSENGDIFSIKMNDGYASCYKNLKVFLTLLNKSPEIVEDQIFLMIEWMEDQKIIDKQEIPEVEIMLADYFKSNKSKWLPELAMQKPIIEKIRDKLNSVSPERYFLAQLEAMEKHLGWGSINKSEFFPQESIDLIEVRYLIPKLYTAEGWKQVVDPLIQSFINDAQRDDWVLGYKTKCNMNDMRKRSPNLLKISLKNAYLKKYKQNWEKFFQNIFLKSFLNTHDASVKLGVLLNSEGSWISLLRFVIENMQPLLMESNNSLQKMKIFLKTSLSNEKNNANDNYEGYIEDLKNVQAELEGLLLHSDQGQAVEQYLRGLFIQPLNNGNSLSTASHKLMKFQKQGDNQIQKNFYKLLLDPLLKVFSVISKEGLLNIEKDWRLDVVEPFNTDLSQKFPFKDTQQEVALADFEHFFNPKKGKIVQFLETRVFCFVQESKGRVIPKRWMGESIPIGSKFFSGIERAKIFTQGLFNQKSGEIEIRLQLFPDPSPYFSEFSIEVNGASHSYQNDPEEWKLLDWPGQSSYPKSTFSATSINPPFKFFETLSGEWSFFRLLKQYASWNKISPGNYRVSFKFQTDKKDGIDSSISFKLKTDTKVDFFKMIEINHFEMVDRVYGKS